MFAPNVDKAQQIKAYEKIGVKVINTLDQLFLYGASLEEGFNYVIVGNDPIVRKVEHGRF
ncbi:hypothetical protein DMX02_30350 [Pseudomonas jessenii]|nr:hypothetical protein DMX02_30350 [Pseudomonas jessenii]